MYTRYHDNAITARRKRRGEVMDTAPADFSPSLALAYVRCGLEAGNQIFLPFGLYEETLALLEDAGASPEALSRVHRIEQMPRVA